MGVIIREERIGCQRLILGDCLEVMPTLGRFDAVVTDPPYALPTVVAQGRTITKNVGDLSMIELSFREQIRVWKSLVGETGRCFIFGDGSSYPVIFRAAYSYFNTASLVWSKGRIGMGREFRKSHELILHCWGAETPVAPSNGVGYADVIQCDPVNHKVRLHPAEKPVDLICQLLRVCGPQVFDPFMGSGSTLVACQRLGMSGTGVEIDPDNFETACRRVEAESKPAGAEEQPDLFISVPKHPKQGALL